ncbi:MAG TPA: biotin/lipoyl-binding protein, partial [Bacteroidales bacterium]
MEKTVKTRKKANKVMPFVLGGILVIGTIMGIYIYYHSQKYTSTDNAQIDANINPIVARVSGYVKSIRFIDNQYVKTGDTLVLLEDNDYRLKLEQAEATLEAAKLNTGISKENIVSAKTNILPAESNLKAAQIRVWKATEDFNRYSLLLQNQATSPEKFDAVKAEKESAEAQL